MEALSRLKATFEAGMGLFRQLNMKTLGRDSRRDGMQKLRCRVKRTEPLQRCTRYVSDTLRQKQYRTVENARLRSTSLSQRCPNACRQSGPDREKTSSLNLGELSDGGLDRGIWTGLSA